MKLIPCQMFMRPRNPCCDEHAEIPTGTFILVMPPLSTEEQAEVEGQRINKLHKRCNSVRAIYQIHGATTIGVDDPWL